MQQNRELVSFSHFVALLNRSLVFFPDYQPGMTFIDVESGYCLCAPMLPITARQALDKQVFDSVSKHYTTSRL